MKTDNAKFLPINNHQISLSTDSYILNFSDEDLPVLIGKEYYPFIRGIITLYGWNWIGYPFGLYRIPAISTTPSLSLFDKRKEFLSKPVFSIMQVDSLVWVANENGLDFFNLEGVNIPLPGRLQGLQNNIVYALGKDAHKRVWFSGNKGIGCISADHTKVVMFGIDNNLQSLEFNHNAFYEDNKGLLYFGGING
ncbi:MAG: hypothetical protein IPH84_02955 [Bacteroidales bacterium]|nr:hypothetical protein [Bacteroidales bacterium]